MAFAAAGALAACPWATGDIPSPALSARRLAVCDFAARRCVGADGRRRRRLLHEPRPPDGRPDGSGGPAAVAVGFGFRHLRGWGGTPGERGALPAADAAAAAAAAMDGGGDALPAALPPTRTATTAAAAVSFRRPGPPGDGLPSCSCGPGGCTCGQAPPPRSLSSSDAAGPATPSTVATALTAAAAVAAIAALPAPPPSPILPPLPPRRGPLHSLAEAVLAPFPPPPPAPLYDTPREWPVGPRPSVTVSSAAAGAARLPGSAAAATAGVTPRPQRQQVVLQRMTVIVADYLSDLVVLDVLGRLHSPADAAAAAGGVFAAWLTADLLSGVVRFALSAGYVTDAPLVFPNKHGSDGSGGAGIFFNAVSDWCAIALLPLSILAGASPRSVAAQAYGVALVGLLAVLPLATPPAGAHACGVVRLARRVGVLRPVATTPTTSYCGLAGVWNPVLDGAGVWRRLEAAVYDASLGGVVSRVWMHSPGAVVEAARYSRRLRRDLLWQQRRGWGGARGGGAGESGRAEGGDDDPGGEVTEAAAPWGEGRPGGRRRRWHGVVKRGGEG